MLLILLRTRAESSFPIGSIGQSTEEATVDYHLNDHPTIASVVETLSVHVVTLDQDGFFRDDVGDASCEVTVQPKPCDGTDGSPVFNGCGTGTTVSPASAHPGDILTISFTPQSGGICGGTWTATTNMPGTFLRLTPSPIRDRWSRAASSSN